MSTEPGPATQASTLWPLTDAVAFCSAIDSGQLDTDLFVVIAAINPRNRRFPHEVRHLAP